MQRARNSVAVARCCGRLHCKVAHVRIRLPLCSLKLKDGGGPRPAGGAGGVFRTYAPLPPLLALLALIAHGPLLQRSGRSGSGSFGRWGPDPPLALWVTSASLDKPRHAYARLCQEKRAYDFIVNPCLFLSSGGRIRTSDLRVMRRAGAHENR